MSDSIKSKLVEISRDLREIAEMIERVSEVEAIGDLEKSLTNEENA